MYYLGTLDYGLSLVETRLHTLVGIDLHCLTPSPYDDHLSSSVRKEKLMTAPAKALRPLNPIEADSAIASIIGNPVG